MKALVFVVLAIYLNAVTDDSPLVTAILADDMPQAVALLQSDADLINKQDAGGYTPMHWAAANGNPEMILALIKFRPEPSIVGWDGGTALHLAAHYDLPEMVSKLIAIGYDVNLKNRWGNTPLHAAARRNCCAVAELLVSAGSDINSITKEGWTPLHYANRSGHKEMVDLLLKLGADDSMKDVSGTRPGEVWSQRPQFISYFIVAEQYVGNYSTIDGGHFKIFERDGQLMVQDIAIDAIHPIGRDTFYCEHEPWKLEFLRDSENNVFKLKVHFLRRVVEANKE